MIAMIEVITGILALLAGGFALVAAVGVVRFPDALTRMHASSKVGAFAGSLALICAAVDIGSVSAVTRAVIAILFLFLTAPVSANMIAKAHIHRQGRRIDANPSDDIIDGLPSPPGTSDWATFGGADEGDPTPISVGPEEQQP